MLAVAAVLPAHAGRPFTTEDAAILDAKACQLETWADRSRAATEAWLVPACNFGGHVEWQLGAARRYAEGNSRLSETYAQAKTVFRHDQEASWNAGLVAGLKRRRPDGDDEGGSAPYVLAPFTVASQGGASSIHATVGWERDRNRHRDLTLWGIAGETALSKKITLLGEAFGENGERPFVRVGARFAAVKDRVEFDLSVVGRSGGSREERIVSLGVTLQTGRLLP